MSARPDVLVGFMGAGKTTVTPLELLNEPWTAGGKLIVLEAATLAEAKTAQLKINFGKLGLSSVLVIAGAEVDVNFARAAANIAHVDVLPQQGANVYDILRRDTLVLTKDAVKHLEERLQ